MTNPPWFAIITGATLTVDTFLGWGILNSINLRKNIEGS